tara:strand:+ start:5580 stop:7259 length:1680 start_codon:yes stop_codon:yes gene_type:complete
MSSMASLNSMKKAIRALKIWNIVLKLILFLWWDAQKWSYIGGYTPDKQQCRQRLRATWITKQLLDLGSAFIKLGQLLSARPDVLPAGWIVELSDLQDRVPAFSFEKAEKILNKELQLNFKEIDELDIKPLGAASIAQVHRAVLKNGRKVIFKIQRPDLENLFRLDLEVMQQVAALLQKKKSWSYGRDWVGIAKECQRVLLRELDFRIEAQYAARFRQQFLDNPKILIPQVIWELSSKRVLCLEYIPGIKINDRIAIEKRGIDPSVVIDIGAKSYLQQLVEFGFFHADPHPGNLAVGFDGSLIYYDFGMMGIVSERLRKRLGSMVRAAAFKDASALVKELQIAGVIAQDIDIGPIRRFVRIVLQEALTPPFKPNIFEKLSGDLYDLVYGKPFQLPVELIFVFRALSTFEGVGRSLDQSFNLISIAKPYLLPLMKASNSNSNDLINEIGRQVGEIGNRAVAIPKRLDESLERLEQGDLKLQIRMGESDRQLRRIISAQQSMGQSILLGCLGITASVLGASQKPVLSIIPIFFASPVFISWVKIQVRMNRDARIDKFPGSKQ